ncbi:Gametogenetin-binding protein 2 [Gryllus bimaculatus]|nr:Gametogenetin-binding protein 2 [Gryllus bimaculatus]
MAQLVDVFRVEKQQPLGRRQLPLMVDENLTMVMDLSSMGLICDSPLIRGKELEEFNKKFNVLTIPEAKEALEVTCKDLLGIISQTVPCVGCRRSVERLFYQLIESGHKALDPLVFTSDGILTVRNDQLSSQILCTMFHGHRTRLSNLVESQTRSKKSHRCNLHSLDSHRSPRPMTSVWRDVWECMKIQCKEEVVLIESSTLLVTLENYLRKHRFCAECRTKVLRAYALLIEEPDPCREKGYVPALYAGIKRCLPEKHIHLQTKTDYIGGLITRADLELMGSRRERHAKTLEIAQEEVLTCLGLCVYERLYRIHLRMREEECTCQVLAAVAIEALCRNFEMAVEGKQGMSQLELLFEQIAKEELAKAQRKEHKKQKRKKKKEKRAEQDEKENTCECESEEPEDTVNEETFSSCTCSEAKPATQNSDRRKLQVLEHKGKSSSACSCKDCQRKKKDKVSVENGSNSSCNHPSKSVACQKSQLQRGRNVTNGHCSSEDLPSPARKTAIHSSVTVVRNPTTSCANLSPENVSLSPCQSCKNAQDSMDEHHARVSDTQTPVLPAAWSSSDHSQDCGYASENNNGCCDTASVSSSLRSSPDGSDIACSDGFCNHEDCQGERSEIQECSRTVNSGRMEESHNHENRYPVLTLEQMLEGGYSSDEDREESYIPAEEVQEFKARMCNVKEQRQELRQMLRKRFDQLCVKAPQFISPRPAHCASN